MDCKSYKKNMAMCNCTYDPCPRKGSCCECMHYHRAMGELPACYFSAATEGSYDRSIRAFIRDQRG